MLIPKLSLMAIKRAVKRKLVEANRSQESHSFKFKPFCIGEDRSSHLQACRKIGIPIIFPKLSANHMCWSLFSRGYRL